MLCRAIRKIYGQMKSFHDALVFKVLIFAFGYHKYFVFSVVTMFGISRRLAA